MSQLVRNYLLEVLLGLTVFIATALIWGSGLEQHVTADEPMYIRESGGFYVALHEKQYLETNRVIHPGVPTLWMGAWAFDRIYPEFSRKGEVDISDFDFYIKLEQTSITLMDLLTLGRLHMARMLALVIGISSVYMRRLVGLPSALFGTVILILDPFLFGHSTLLATDAPLSIFAFASVLSLLNYVRFRRPADLLVSSFLAALAVLSKITGLYLVFFVFIVLLVDSLAHREPVRFFRSLRDWMAWLFVMVLVCFVTWPALWEAPLAILQNLLTFTVASVEGEVNSNSFFMGHLIPNGDLGGWKYLHFYPLAILWRTTPISLIGLLLGGLTWFLQKKWKIEGFRNSVSVRWLLVYIVFVLVLMSLSSKKIDRYVLPVFPVLAVLAGIGYTGVLKIIVRQVRSRRKETLKILLAAFLWVSLTAGSWLQLQRAVPAPLNSFNSLLGTTKDAARIFVVGWGEGLEFAAGFLNQQENAKELKVYSWYAAALNVQFDGRAKDLPISTPIDDAWFDEIFSSDYIILYYHQHQRGTTQRVLDALAGQEPVFTYAADGIEWVTVFEPHDNSSDAP